LTRLDRSLYANILTGNLREALNSIEQTSKKLVTKGPLEYAVLHACLLAHPHPGMTPDEIAKNRQTARTMLGELHNLVASASTEEDFTRLRGAGQDPDIFLDLAAMWQDENFDRAIAAYQTSVSVISASEEAGRIPPGLKSVKMAGNLGVMYQMRGDVDTAQRMYQEALHKLGQKEGPEAEKLRTILAYNLGRAFEDEGDVVRAERWYRDVLRQHPEHMECELLLVHGSDSF
jgi:RNA polymerase-associated protein CTR9